MRVRLNNKFYNKETVEQTLKDFKEVCKGKILNGDIEVELEPKEDVKELEGEFCNYVLGLMKNSIIV